MLDVWTPLINHFAGCKYCNNGTPEARKGGCYHDFFTTLNYARQSYKDSVRRWGRWGWGRGGAAGGWWLVLVVVVRLPLRCRWGHALVEGAAATSLQPLQGAAAALAPLQRCHTAPPAQPRPPPLPQMEKFFGAPSGN
jgi:hypothetical protein